MKAGQKRGQACDTKQKLWQIMRGLQSFTLDDVARITGINMSIVAKYVTRLHKAGYLRVEGKEKGPKRSRSIFRLIKNSGAQAPFETTVIFDPNLRRVVFNEGDIREKGK